MADRTYNKISDNEIEITEPKTQKIDIDMIFEDIKMIDEQIAAFKVEKQKLVDLLTEFKTKKLLSKDNDTKLTDIVAIDIKTIK